MRLANTLLAVLHVTRARLAISRLKIKASVHLVARANTATAVHVDTAKQASSRIRTGAGASRAPVWVGTDTAMTAQRAASVVPGDNQRKTLRAAKTVALSALLTTLPMVERALRAQWERNQTKTEALALLVTKVISVMAAPARVVRRVRSRRTTKATATHV